MRGAGLRRLLAVAGLELRSALTGALFWGLLGFALLCGAALNVTAFTTAGGAVRPYVNSQHAMAWLFAMSGFLVYGFFTSILAGTAPLRDDDLRVSELLHATPLSRRQYLAGKLLGVLAAVGLALVLHVLITVAWTELAPVAPGLDRGPFRWAHYLLPAVVFPLPLVLFCAGAAFALGVRTRRAVAVYALPVALFFAVAWLMAWGPADLHPGLDRLLMIVDPTGLRWLLRTVLGVDRGVGFYNAAPLPVDATLVAGRLATLAVPAAAVGWVMLRDRGERSAGGTATSQSAVQPGQESPAACDGRRSSPRPATGLGAALAPLGMAVSPPGFAAGVARVARVELRQLRGQPGLYLFVPLLMLLVWETVASVRGVYGSAVTPTAGRLAVEALGVTTLLACLVLLFYTVQAVTRERTTGFRALLESSPVPTGAILLAKGVAHAAVLAALLAGCAVVAVAMLVAAGSPLRPGPLLLVWGPVLVPTLVLWVCFVTALLAAVRDPHATYALALGALGLSLHHLRSESATWVTHWTLLGALRWSDLGTFALNREPLLLNRLLVLAAALLLAVVAARLYPRVEADPVGRWHRFHPRRAVRLGARLAPLAALVALLAVPLGLGVRDGFQGGAEEEWAREYRRRNLVPWHRVEPPHVTRLDLAVDLRPAARSARVEGTFTLVDSTPDPMPRLAFTVGRSFQGVRWWVEGEEVPFEDRSGLHVLRPLAAPVLEPGREIRVSFAYRLVAPRGYTRKGGGVEQFILPSGVFLHTLRDSALPVPGFVAGVGAASAPAYEPAEPDPDRWRRELAADAGSPRPFDLRMEVTAPAAFTVTGTGRKVAETTEGERTTSVWETAHPVRALCLVAGRWQVRRRAGVAVYHHPAHSENVEEMLDTLAAARRRYSEWFHPYPWRELRISEIPGLADNAMGFATNVAFSESLGFLAAAGDPGRPVFLVTAHEAAHQWWGNLLAPASGPGTGYLVEGLAHFSALLLAEAEHGEEARRHLARSMERSYLRSRRADTEPSLLRTVDDRRPSDRAVVYDKGAWVTWMLQRHLGRQRFLAGLRGFVRTFRDGPDHPTPRDLVEHLRPFAADPAAYEAFVDTWFRRVVLPEIRLSRVSVEPVGERWRVSATVENLGTGSVPVEVAVIGEGASGAAPGGAGTAEARSTVRPAPGEPAALQLEVGFEPRRLVVDPDVHLLQRGRERAAVAL